MPNKRQKRESEVPKEHEDLMVETALALYDKARLESDEKGQEFFKSKAFTSLPEEIRITVAEVIDEREEGAENQKVSLLRESKKADAKRLGKIAEELEGLGYRKDALDAYKEAFEKGFYQKAILMKIVQLLVVEQSGADALAFLDELDYEGLPKGIKRQWIIEAKENFSLKYPMEIREDKEDVQVDDNTIEEEESVSSSNDLIREFLEYHEAFGGSVEERKTFAQIAVDRIDTLLKDSGIDRSKTVAEIASSRMEHMEKVRDAMEKDLGDNLEVWEEKMKGDKKEGKIQEREMIARYSAIFRENIIDNLFDSSEQEVHIGALEDLGEFIEFLQGMEGEIEEDLPADKLQEDKEYINDIINDALFLERRKIEMIEQLRMRIEKSILGLSKGDKKRKTVEEGEEVLYNEMVRTYNYLQKKFSDKARKRDYSEAKKKYDKFVYGKRRMDINIIQDLQAFGIDVIDYDEKYGEGREEYEVEIPSGVDKDGEIIYTKELVSLVDPLLESEMKSKTTKEVDEDFEKVLESFQGEARKIGQRLQHASLPELDNMLGEDGEINKLRFKYDKFDHVALGRLVEDIGDIEPGKEITQQDVDQWGEYVEFIIGRVDNLTSLVCNESMTLEGLARDRKDSLEMKEEEKLWKEKGLSEAVQAEISTLEKEWEKMPWSNDSELDPQSGINKSIEEAARQIARRLIRINPGDKYDENKRGSRMKWDIEKWTAVLDHFIGKLPSSRYPVQEVAAVQTEVMQNRKDNGDTFDYSKGGGRTLVNWKGMLGDRYKEGELPIMNPKQILKECDLKPWTEEAEALLEFFDHLEALRFIKEKRGKEKKQIDQERASIIAQKEAEREKAKKEWEALSPEERHRIETQERQERYKHAQYVGRAEFFALAHFSATGRGDEVKKYHSLDNKGKQKMLLEIYSKTMEERGVSIPTDVFRNFKAGDQYVRNWDTFKIKENGEEIDVDAYVEGYDEDTGEVLIRRINKLETNRFQRKPGPVERIKKEDIVSHESPVPKSLDGKTAIAIARKAGVNLTGEGYGDRNIHLVAAGDYEPGTVAINTGNHDGNEFSAEEERLFKKYFELRKPGKHKDFFTKHRIDITRFTEFVDHHARGSQKESSASEYLFEKLAALGAFENIDAEEMEAMENVLKFVEREDNKSHPEWLSGENWDWEKDSAETLLGIGNMLSFDTMTGYYKKHKDDPDVDIRKFTPDDLVDFPELNDIIKEHRKTIKKTMKALEDLESNGNVVDTKYGKLVVFTPFTPNGSSEVRMGIPKQAIDAIRSKYKDGAAMLIWNPLIMGGKMFFSTTGAKVEGEDFRGLGNGQVLRDTMALGHNMTADLWEVLEKLLPEGIRVQDVVNRDSIFGKYIGKDGQEVAHEKKYRRVRFEKPTDFATEEAKEYFGEGGPKSIEEYVDKYEPDLLAPTQLRFDRASGKVRIAGSSWNYAKENPDAESPTNFKDVIVNVPKDFNPTTIKPENRYWLKPNKIIINQRYGRITYVVEVVKHPDDKTYEDAFSHEIVNLENSLKEILERDLKGEDVGRITSYDIARLMGQADHITGKRMWDSYIETRESVFKQRGSS